MAIEGIAGYPLYWPDGWKRTPSGQRRRSNYSMTFMRARDEVARHLKLMHAAKVIVSSGVPLRIDGLPLANQREPTDPGVAAYWDVRAWDQKLGQHQTTTRVIACDHWLTVRENMRAVAFALDSLRQLDRCGASEILDRAYTGFTALPANAGAAKPRWRDVLGIGDGPVSESIIAAAYRTKAQQYHPDRGGTHQQMADVNEARAQALKELMG